ncbi:AHH domain-containing protein [Aeribacillus sp. FSL K6-1305]|uniref:AHH domain-containing protein n=1 Tax=Aeribacillus sp. FSL K6-1305 TaxID=2954569 RepID=UPI0030FD3F59
MAKEIPHHLKNKSANSALKTARFVDNALTNLKNSIPDRQMGFAMEGIGNVKVPVENTNGLENKVRAYLSEKTGLNLGGGKAGNDGVELSTKGTGKPLQKHHYATNKSKKYTPQIEAITKKYGLDLDDVWNIELLPHQGRHPNAYHEYVLSNIRTFDKIAKGDKRKFLRLFEQLKQEIRKNPEMLYKDYWRKK